MSTSYERSPSKNKGKLYIPWESIEATLNIVYERFKILNKKFDAVTGIPRGGLIPAIMYSHISGLPYIEFKPENMKGNILIFEDVADTGETYEKYTKVFSELNITSYFTFLIAKPWFKPSKPNNCLILDMTEDWVVFPWEIDND